MHGDGFAGLVTRTASLVGRLFTSRGAGVRSAGKGKKKRELVQSYNAQLWLLLPYVLW